MNRQLPASNAGAGPGEGRAAGLPRRRTRVFDADLTAEGDPGIRNAVGSATHAAGALQTGAPVFVGLLPAEAYAAAAMEVKADPGVAFGAVLRYVDPDNYLVAFYSPQQNSYGTDYYQNQILWGAPAALAGQDIAAPLKPGGLADRIIKAAKEAP